MRIDLKKMSMEVCEIARKAGKFILASKKKFSLDKVESKGANDFVSFVDVETEQLIVKKLAQLLPDAGFKTEEGTAKSSSAAASEPWYEYNPATGRYERREKEKTGRYSWIIDPLDGTTNFIHGMSPYSVSIALTEYDEPVIGVVYIANTDECFFAWKGSNAHLNSQRIRVSSISALKDSLVITGFPHQVGEKIDNYLNLIRHLTFNSHGVRRLGSAAADLVYIAAGRAEVFFQTDLNPWDVAAGALIAQRAGAVVTDFRNDVNYIFGKSIIATANRALNNELRTLTDKFFPEQV
jgi:myo-inositol-1(or 4)-monophosphatase